MFEDGTAINTCIPKYQRLDVFFFFITDGHPIMATGSTQGHIALWNLEERKLQSQMRESHSGAVSGMKCLPSEPLMVTSSSDNSLKVCKDKFT